MAGPLITEHIADVIRTQSIPGITLWNRLEGRPRAEAFDRALRAEIRDPLWLLTRQWQLGEFRGDDAGSPIDVRVSVESSRLSRYRPGDGPAVPFPESVPLETHVERMPLRFTQRDGATSTPLQLDIRLLLGRQWLRMLATIAPSAAVRADYTSRYAITAPDPHDPADALTTAHPEAWSSVAAVAGRRMDGGLLLEHLRSDAAHRASDGIASLGGLAAQVDALGDRFVAWAARLIHEPSGPSAWQPERLEYRFATSAPAADGNEKVFVADEYFQGHLDWYSLDLDRRRASIDGPDAAAVPPCRATFSALPTQAVFPGMPNTRWWRFEDGRTDFGDVAPDTTDLAKLLLIEFGLVYAGDWFIVPHTVAAGSVVQVKGVAVTNVFGERTWVTAAGAGDDEDWQRWAMFLPSVAGDADVPAELSLVIPPAAQQTLEGRPLEEVALARDEMANMVWGVERIVPLPSGDTKDGRLAAGETRDWHERELADLLGHAPAPLPPAEGAKIRYQVQSSVPENWIPLIPVRVEGSNREIQLQRGAMLRILEGDPAGPAPVRPRTSLLRVGLDDTPATGYFLHEEEVPRAGIRVTQAFQRVRGQDGQVWVWLGVHKQTGRGEGSSGLAFDRLVDVPPEE